MNNTEKREWAKECPQWQACPFSKEYGIKQLLKFSRDEDENSNDETNDEVERFWSV